MNTIQAVDVVISWVDGNDPAHKQKIKPFLDSQSRKSDDIAGSTRFDSVGEIFYCIASIYRFAPFVRKIFIISDNQNPCMDEFIQENFPESKIEIEIVDVLDKRCNQQRYCRHHNRGNDANQRHQQGE